MNNYKISIFFTSMVMGAFFLIFFFQPSVMIAGVRKGITVCGSSVIPSLLPFTVLSDFLIRSGMANRIGNRLDKPIGLFFKLPGVAGCVMLMSLVGGFPVGAKMIAQLTENGEISKKQGRRMICFCINPGPAFSVGTVGAVMLNNTTAGLILYVSLVIASVSVGIATGFLAKEYEPTQNRKLLPTDISVLSDSVNGSVNAVLNLCGWIMLFSGIIEFLPFLPVSVSGIRWLTMLLEVTNGCCSAAGNFPTCFLAFAMGWAGLSVHFQLLQYLKTVGMKLTHLWVSRLVCGGVAVLTAEVLFNIFPCEVSVFSTASNVISSPVSVSVYASVAVLILNVFLLTDLNLARIKKV